MQETRRDHQRLLDKQLQYDAISVPSHYVDISFPYRPGIGIISAATSKKLINR
jgi:hypothetical protein